MCLCNGITNNSNVNANSNVNNDNNTNNTIVAIVFNRIYPAQITRSSDILLALPLFCCYDCHC